MESFAGFAMTCGHPLAARQIVGDNLLKDPEHRLQTTCWACAVQREIVSRIVGPKAAKRRDGAA